MARTGHNYAYVRSYASLGRDLDDIQKVLGAGYGGVMLDYRDPYLAQAVADLQKAGIQYGLWGDPHDMPLEDFAKEMASLNAKYRPTVISPDLEFRFKGYQGSAGWLNNEQLANLWAKYLPGVNTIVSVMPRQDDYNYAAWLKQGAAFAPQAYGADPNKEVFDPNDIVQTLLGQGVPMDLIYPLLGPGHQQGYNGAGLWTVDDFIQRSVLPTSAYNRAGIAPPRSTQGAEPPKAPILPSAKRQPGLSQSAPMIQASGLRWGGQTMNNMGDMKRYVASRGGNIVEWAKRHPTAYAALLSRSKPKGAS